MRIKHGFSVQFKTELDSKINNLFDILFLNKNMDYEELNSRNLLYNQNNQLIQEQYDKNDIHKKKFDRFWLQTKVIFTVGINKKYVKQRNENRIIIANFKEFKSQKLEENAKLKEANINYLYAFLNGLNKYQIFNWIFNELKFYVGSDWNFDDIDEKFSQECFGKYTNNDGCFKFFVRNNPVYLVRSIYESFLNVKTSNYVTRSYYKTYTNKDGKTVTKLVYKKIWAHHVEPTPYRYDKLWLKFCTKYVNELEFNGALNGSLPLFSKPYKGFENKEFVKTIKIGIKKNDIGNQVKLHEFFDIKSQENYVNLAKTESLFIIQKLKDKILIFFNNKQQELFAWINENNTFENNNYVKVWKDLNGIKKIFVDVVKKSVLTIFAAIEQVLAIPGIATEKYTNDRYTRSENLNSPEQLINHEITWQRVLTKSVNDKKFFYAISFDEVGMFPSYQDVSCSIEKNINVINFNYESYIKKNEIDQVYVHDEDCGLVIVPVNYVRYYSKNEPKIVFYLIKKSSQNVVFKILPKKIFEPIKLSYTLKNLDEFYENKIIIENFENITDNKKYSELLSFFKQFFLISQQFKNSISLRVDNDGIFLYINDPSLISDYKDIFFNFLNQYESINF